MISYENHIFKQLKKGTIPKHIFINLDNAFRSIDLTKDFSLFDIKLLKERSDRKTYRLRKGKYRALFYVQKSDIFVFNIEKREDAYK